MATHSSVLAWRVPGTGEPGGLRSTGSHRKRLSSSSSIIIGKQSCSILIPGASEGTERQSDPRTVTQLVRAASGLGSRFTSRQWLRSFYSMPSYR